MAVFTRSLIVTATAVLAISLLAACSQGTDVPSTPTPSPTPTATPTYAPQADASTNEDFFRYTVEQALSQHGLTTPTTEVAQALVNAGFAKTGIQYGDSSTAIGMKPDSVMVAAQQGDGCLVAQYGPSITELAISVTPVLSSGGCLIGRTINHL